jgi:1,4-dihydroxy-2-naphthoyl-CoA hydrolase
MPLWKQQVSLERVDAWRRNTLLETLDIRVTEIGDDYVRGTLPVDGRTHQPYGLLHGGASVALAETLGSIGAMLTLDAAREVAVGIEINANHVRAVRSGRVTGTARALHLGRGTQVWEIRIEDDLARLVCIARLTVAVVPREALAARS